MIRRNNQEEIGIVINQFAKQTRNLVKSCVELIYYMRGAVTYNEVMNMSAAERDLLSEFINERLKEASKMSFPVF